MTSHNTQGELREKIYRYVTALVSAPDARVDAILALFTTELEKGIQEARLDELLTLSEQTKGTAGSRAQTIATYRYMIGRIKTLSAGDESEV